MTTIVLWNGVLACDNLNTTHDLRTGVVTRRELTVYDKTPCKIVKLGDVVIAQYGEINASSWVVNDLITKYTNNKPIVPEKHLPEKMISDWGVLIIKNGYVALYTTSPYGPSTNITLVGDSLVSEMTGIFVIGSGLIVHNARFRNAIPSEVKTAKDLVALIALYDENTGGDIYDINLLTLEGNLPSYAIYP